MQDTSVPQLIINKLTKEQYESIQEPSDTQLYLITDEDETAGGASRNIGEIVASTLPLTDAGLHLLDGALISGSGIYADFVNYIAGLDSTANYFCTETEWQQSVTDYGVCGKFVYDSINNTVRLPKITGIIEGTTDVNALGDLVEAGLPNITGDVGGTTGIGHVSNVSYGLSVHNTNTSGAFYANSNCSYTATKQSEQGTNGKSLGFNASLSSSIYGNSSTVQPQTIRAFYYIVVATSTKADIQVDIDEIVTDLNGKVDRSDLEEVQCVVETYQNGTSWYRVYSDGWCEQGGVATGAQITVSLLKPYKDTTYYASWILLDNTSTSNLTFQYQSVRSRTTSTFVISASASTSFTTMWEAKGYI